MVTDHVKAKIFAQYPNQRVKKGNFKRELLGVIFDDTYSFAIAECEGLRMWDYFKDNPNAKLILRPITNLTDEELSMLAKIAMKWPPTEDEEDELTYEEIDIENISREHGVTKIRVTCRCFEGFVWVNHAIGTLFIADEDGKYESVSNSLMCYQYLQSIGIDLPNYLLDGKTLHECGLCVYEGEEIN